MSGARYRDRRVRVSQPREHRSVQALAKLTDQFAGTCCCVPHRSSCGNSRRLGRLENYVKVPRCPPRPSPAITLAASARRYRTPHSCELHIGVGNSLSPTRRGSRVGGRRHQKRSHSGSVRFLDSRSDFLLHDQRPHCVLSGQPRQRRRGSASQRIPVSAATGTRTSRRKAGSSRHGAWLGRLGPVGPPRLSSPPHDGLAAALGADLPRAVPSGRGRPGCPRRRAGRVCRPR